MSHSKGSVGREPGVPPQGSNIVYRSREEAVGEPVGKADSRDEHFQHVLNTLLGSQTYQQPQFSSSKKEDIDTYGVGVPSNTTDQIHKCRMLATLVRSKDPKQVLCAFIC